MGAFAARALPGIPEIRPRHDPGEAIAAALDRSGAGRNARRGAVLAVAHTAVSKAEGAVVELAGVEPTERARELASEQDKDPAVMQVVLDESAEILRAERGVLIA